LLFAQTVVTEDPKQGLQASLKPLQLDVKILALSLVLGQAIPLR